MGKITKTREWNSKTSTSKPRLCLWVAGLNSQGKNPLWLKYDLLDSAMCFFKQRCAISRLILHLFYLSPWFPGEIMQGWLLSPVPGDAPSKLGSSNKAKWLNCKTFRNKRVEKSLWSESSEERLWINQDLINCWMTEENIPEKAENGLFWHRIIYN